MQEYLFAGSQHHRQQQEYAATAQQQEGSFPQRGKRSWHGCRLPGALLALYMPWFSPYLAKAMALLIW